MIKKIIYPLFRLSSKVPLTRNFLFPQIKNLYFANPVMYNFSKFMKKNTSKVNKTCAEEQVKELYKRVGWSVAFKQQYKKLISKYTNNGDFPNLIKLKEYRVKKDEQHNDENNQSHLLELYQLAALNETQQRPDQIEFYFKKIYELLQKFPGLIQINDLNEIISYMIGKHLFGLTIDRREQAKKWYQIFKQKIDANAVPSINDDLKFYFHFQLAVIYLDLKMLKQSLEQFNKFREVLQGGKIKVEKNTIMVALFEFAEAQIERGDKSHALQVVDILLSKVNTSNKDEIQYVEKSQQLIEEFAKSQERSKELLKKIQNIKQKFSNKNPSVLSSSSLPPKKSKKSPIIPNIKQVEALWSNFSEDYNKFDYCPQTLYYSFLYMLQIWEGKNILQVACGTGKLLPIAINMKEKSANYLAVDLSPQMIQLTKKNLRRNFELYDSKVTFEQWLKKNNIDIMVANGEEPISKPQKFSNKFDRIICNCCLMLTSDAEKMLKNLYQEAQKGCLLGVSVWGDKNNNNLMTSIREAYLQAQVQLPQQRSNFHLYKKVPALAERCGWQTVVSWEQNALFPALSADSEKYKSFFFHQVEKIPQPKRSEVKNILMAKLAKYFGQDKKGLNFSCEMIILRKK